MNYLIDLQDKYQYNKFIDLIELKKGKKFDSYINYHTFRYVIVDKNTAQILAIINNINLLRFYQDLNKI